MKILILLIAYKNAEEVVAYLAKLQKAVESSGRDIHVMITDNHADFTLPATEHFTFPVTVLDPGANLGYLSGCHHGLAHYLKHNALPDWVCICNTDLELPHAFFSMLNGAEKNVGQMSPVVVKRNGKMQNPHMAKRPGTQFYLKQKAIHANSYLGALYIWLSGRKKTEHATKNLQRVDASRDQMSMYAAHGSIFFLSKAFFECGGSIAGGPFLFGEEIYIGEQLHKFQLASICQLKYTVVHEAHGSSRFVSLRRRSKLFRDSFRLLYSNYKSLTN